MRFSGRMIRYILCSMKYVFIDKSVYLIVLILILNLTGLAALKANPKTEINKLKVLSFALRYPYSDVIVVNKKARLLYYCRNGKIVSNEKWDGFEYSFPVPISLGLTSRFWTPEGEYYICNKNPYSRYTLFLGISYPSIKDAERSYETYGVKISPYQKKQIELAQKLKTKPPWNTPLGGTFGIHGAATGYARTLSWREKKDPSYKWVTKKDRTRGCVAVENRVIKYLYAKIDTKTPVLIF